jgi:hypothetical protein
MMKKSYIFHTSLLFAMLMMCSGMAAQMKHTIKRPAQGMQTTSDATAVKDGTQGDYGITVTLGNEQYIRVRTAEQFLNALGSHRNVLVAADTEINLTPLLNDQSIFRTKYRVWTSDISGGMADGREVVASEEVTDGRQLTLVNFEQLNIVGERNSRIVVEPRYAFCLRFVDCKQCEVRNLTIGHTEDGNCTGGVIGDLRGWRIYVVNCDLYGCGAYGLELERSNSFELRNSNIHNCTYGIMTLSNVTSMTASHCNFFNNREYSLIGSGNSAGVVFDDCWFFNNEGTLFSFDSEFYLRNSKVFHPESDLGSMEMANQSGGNNEFGEIFSYHGAYGQMLEKRNRKIGPDVK